MSSTASLAYNMQQGRVSSQDLEAKTLATIKAGGIGPASGASSSAGAASEAAAKKLYSKQKACSEAVEEAAAMFR